MAGALAVNAAPQKWNKEVILTKDIGNRCLIIHTGIVLEDNMGRNSLHLSQTANSGYYYMTYDIVLNIYYEILYFRMDSTIQTQSLSELNICISCQGDKMRYYIILYYEYYITFKRHVQANQSNTIKNNNLKMEMSKYENASTDKHINILNTSLSVVRETLTILSTNS